MKKSIAIFGMVCRMLTPNSVGKELTVSDVPLTVNDGCSIPLPETTRLHLKRTKDDKAKAPEQSGAKADQEAE